MLKTKQKKNKNMDFKSNVSFKVMASGEHEKVVNQNF